MAAAKPARILLLDPGNFTPYYDMNLGYALSQRGWQVDWVTSRHAFEDIPVPRGVRVEYRFFGAFHHPLLAPRAGATWLRAVRRLAKALTYPVYVARLDAQMASMTPGVLHVQWAPVPWVDAFYWKRWKRMGWRVAYTAHDVTPLAGTTPRALSGSYVKLCRAADLTVVHSLADRRRLERAGVRSERIRTIPQGGPGIFFRQGPEAPDARMALGVEGRRPVILFFGFLKPYKGLDVLLQSLPSVRERHPTVLALIAGESTLPMATWARAVRNGRLDGNVRFDKGWVPTERVGTYFAAADVVVLPYLSASTSAVLLLAQAHGCVVVATSVGPMPELIAQGRSGLTVPPADPEALAQAVIELLDSPPRSRAIGQTARAMVEESHGWAEIAVKTEALYGELLGL